MPPAARSYGLATAALVCGLVGLLTFWILGIVPLLGLIFGLISARAIKRSNGTLVGLGKARAGWITGLIGVVGGAAFIWAGATGRLENDDEDASDKSSYLYADVGDCITDFPDIEIVFELDFVSCDEQHGAEMYNTGELNPDGNRDYPGDETLLLEVQTACEAGFEPYVGRAYEQSVFEVYYLYPRAFGWKADRGGYFCFLGEVGKTTSGTAFRSDR